MFHLLYSPWAGGALTTILMLGYILYRSALPRPIPGIPYHRESATRIIGDALGMVQHNQKHGTVTDWWTLQGIKLNSPIFQLFLKPFSKPMVFVLDPRETLDVLLRRSKDFDRSEFFADLFVGEIPNHHIVQPTNDKFRRGRRLLADTMSAGFLASIAAPSLHKHTLELMDLWRTKNKLAAGHAFWVADDINHFALDSIWDVALGSQLNSVRQELDLLEADYRVDLPKSTSEAVIFRKPNFTVAVRSMKIITHTLDKTAVSPLPRQTHWVMRLLPTYRRARAEKENLIQASLDDAKSRLLGNISDSIAEFAGITCATDFMVRREAKAAVKEGRQPTFDSRQAKDELVGFLVGGHDTTATTLMWMMKLMADSPDVQTKLRDLLITAFQGINGAPTPEQIVNLSLPYLDAVIEEIIRCSQTASIVVRKAVHDTQLLGHHIPKGVDVYFLTNGPGYIAPNDLNDKIPESVRSLTSRESKDRAIPTWDSADVSDFRPDRWIKENNEGLQSFNNQAGPVMQFGAGIRGCFGRKLAYLEIRTVLVLLVWTFELLPVPEKLGTYEAFDSLTHKPKACYLILKETGGHIRG